MKCHRLIRSSNNGSPTGTCTGAGCAPVNSVYEWNLGATDYSSLLTAGDKMLPTGSVFQSDTVDAEDATCRSVDIVTAPETCDGVNLAARSQSTNQLCLGASIAGSSVNNLATDSQSSFLKDVFTSPLIIAPAAGIAAARVAPATASIYSPVFGLDPVVNTEHCPNPAATAESDFKPLSFKLTWPASLPVGTHSVVDWDVSFDVLMNIGTLVNPEAVYCYASTNHVRAASVRNVVDNIATERFSSDITNGIVAQTFRFSTQQVVRRAALPAAETVTHLTVYCATENDTGTGKVFVTVAYPRVVAKVTTHMASAAAA